MDEKKLNKKISRWETLKDCRRSQGEKVRDFVDRFYTANEAVQMVRQYEWCVE